MKVKSQRLCKGLAALHSLPLHNAPLLECKLSKPSAGSSGGACLITGSTSQHSPAAVDTVVGKTDTVPPPTELMV